MGKTKYINKFEYELKQPVEIASAGKNIEAYSLVIFAPTNQTFTDVNIINVEYKKAQKNAVQESASLLKEFTPQQVTELRNNTKEEEIKLTSEDVINQMLTYGSDLDRCVFALKNIVSAGNKEKPQCIIDNEKMTKSIFDDLSVADTLSILGEYIINFLGGHQNI